MALFDKLNTKTIPIDNIRKKAGDVLLLKNQILTMEFKIDTKDTFAVVTPITNTINVSFAEKLAAQLQNIRQNGSNNIIVDLQHIQSADKNGLSKLVALHEESYAQNSSLVFTEAGTNLWNDLKVNETDLLLNIAPKMIEAVDIISMEILERDLLGEE